MSRHIPKMITGSAKQGFSSPDSSWFKGKSINLLKRLILDKDSLIYDFLDFETAKRLVNRHIDGKENRRLLIWSLLYMELWLKQNG